VLDPAQCECLLPGLARVLIPPASSAGLGETGLCAGFVVAVAELAAEREGQAVVRDRLGVRPARSAMKPRLSSVPASPARSSCRRLSTRAASQ